MTTRDDQNAYLFKMCGNLFVQGLSKSRAVGPLRSAAFAAGYSFGKMALLASIVRQGLVDGELQSAFEDGVSVATNAFEPPKWGVLATTECAEVVGV